VFRRVHEPALRLREGIHRCSSSRAMWQRNASHFLSRAHPSPGAWFVMSRGQSWEGHCSGGANSRYSVRHYFFGFGRAAFFFFAVVAFFLAVFFGAGLRVVFEAFFFFALAFGLVVAFFFGLGLGLGRAAGAAGRAGSSKAGSCSISAGDSSISGSE